MLVPVFNILNILGPGYLWKLPKCEIFLSGPSLLLTLQGVRLVDGKEKTFVVELCNSFPLKAWMVPHWVIQGVVTRYH